MTSHPRSKPRQIVPRICKGLVLSLVVSLIGVKVYRHLFGSSEFEKRSQAVVVAEYALQPERQEAIARWMQTGIIKRIQKHGPSATILVAPQFSRFEPSLRENIVATVFAVYFMEDKSFRELEVKNCDTGKSIGVYRGSRFEAY